MSVKAVNDTKLSVRWNEALGDVTRYMVKYCSTSDSKSVGSVLVPHKKTVSALLSQLLPGECYVISVSSLNGDMESHPEPTNGVNAQTSKMFYGRFLIVFKLELALAKIKCFC